MKKDIITELNEQKRKVDFNTFDISVKELISMVADGIIDIAPEYQRQFRWGEVRQSILIESIFLGIPVPSLFMATNPNNTWELIDGVQRICTIIHFAGDDEARAKIKLKTKLKLEELEKLTTFIDKTYEALPKSIQLDFLLKPLKVITLSDKSDKSVRFDLFERLNTGGVRLSNQEIRACIFRGKFNDFLKELSKDSDFKKTVRLPHEKENDGTREEMVLRFFAFLHNYKKFEHSVKDFLNDYMENASKKFDYDENESIFKETFARLSKLPNGITRARKTTPTNLYEAVAVGGALAYKKKGKINIKKFDEWVDSTELTKLTTGATNSNTKVVGRIEYCLNKFIK